MKNYKEIILVMTCGACPEQYDAFYEGKEIGYLRLRHGYFRAEYKGNTVYDTDTIGDGIFADEERKKHLKKAKKAIYKAMVKDLKNTHTCKVCGKPFSDNDDLYEHYDDVHNKGNE